MPGWHVRRVSAADAGRWLRLRHALWPDETIDEHRAAIDRFFGGERHEPAEALLAVADDGTALGFAELSIRSIVDGCLSAHVGYLEGWYVEPHVRRRGVGRALVDAAEEWAASVGCVEFGSDALVENVVSRDAHRALGFEETGCVANFRKPINPGVLARRPPFRASDEIAVHVSDPAAAEAFWVNVLGCGVVDRTPDCISLRSGALRLYLVRDPIRAHDAVVPSFDVPDRKAALAALEAAGCTFVPVGPHAPGEVYVRDPGGVVFDVIERPGP
jgi:aminoglycoside 6'-N-acetyltransferase I